MTMARILFAAIALLATTVTASAQDAGCRPLRFGINSDRWYDGRNDNRDFPTNGFFPGNFAGDRTRAATGAAGLLGSNPWRSATPYPSQAILGPRYKPPSFIRFLSPWREKTLAR